jgi:hypothetical protein
MCLKNTEILPALFTQITSVFFFYVNETSDGSFLYILRNVHAIYLTSVVFPCVVGLETPIDAQSNITVLTVAYSLSYFVVLAADNTPSCWFTLLSVGGILLGK